MISNQKPTIFLFEGVPITCAEIQKKTRAPKDGHYNIWIRGKMIRIYCAEMHTLTPKEYLTLGNSDNDHEGRDEWENYSEFYEKRLIRADSCPSNGQRLETCHCIETGPMSGLTIFQKIRLNITSLTVISDDFRFTRQVHGQPIEYGKAGDCYSLSNCPQVSVFHSAFDHQCSVW